MSTIHQFGGDWTIEKLERVRKYLKAYTTIFNANPKAQKLHTIYVDAFAGTGYRTSKPIHAEEISFPEGVEEDNQAFLKGSARIALEVEPPFKEYIFIERDPDYVHELTRLRAEFASQRGKITIISQDANTYLLDWIEETNWRTSRAVVFLDPYGMEVEWPVCRLLGVQRQLICGSSSLWVLQSTAY